MTKFSLIMPVYNSQKYLNKCMDSILNQNFTDFELICINDGSTDESLKILKEYENADSRLKIISHENRGAGASRNIGISHAQGEYIYFIDSDDELESDALNMLNSFIKDKEFDFIMFKIKNFDETTGEIIRDDYYDMSYLKERVCENSFNYNDVSDIALKLSVCPPGILFKREFIEDIRFPEGLLFEDNVFFAEAIFKAREIYFYDEYIYIRYMHNDSTSQSLSVKSLDTIEITNILLDLCETYDYNHKKELYYRIFNNIYYIFKKADKSQKEEFFNKIKDEYLKSSTKWENDDYFKNKLNPRFKHIYKCALKSRNASGFEKCVDNFNREGRFKKLRKKFL